MHLSLLKHRRQDKLRHPAGDLVTFDIGEHERFVQLIPPHCPGDTPEVFGADDLVGRAEVFGQLMGEVDTILLGNEIG